MLVLVAGIAVPALAQTPPGPMPYTAVHHPEFVAASEATFLQDDDILLGVASGKVAKAFPAADLAQHGAVFDQLPDGPISVTWCGVCNTGAGLSRRGEGSNAALPIRPHGWRQRGAEGSGNRHQLAAGQR